MLSGSVQNLFRAFLADLDCFGGYKTKQTKISCEVPQGTQIIKYSHKARLWKHYVLLYICL